MHGDTPRSSRHQFAHNRTDDAANNIDMQLQPPGRQRPMGLCASLLFAFDLLGAAHHAERGSTVRSEPLFRLYWRFDDA